MAYSTITKPSDYFNTKIYAPDGSSSFAVTGVGFQPDWVWVKSRNYAEDHQLNDSVRGATKGLQSNLTNAETTQSNGLTSFDSDGFTVGNLSDYNFNGDSIASWNWLGANASSSNTDGSITSSVSANTTSGFSIVSYTGTGATATVGHGLTQAPEIYFTKNLDKGSGAGSDWLTLFTIIDGSQDFMYLNKTDAVSDSSFSAPTSSLINLNSSSLFINTLNERTVMYCFHSVKGYSKIGTYTGNGNADGTFVYTGFKPAWVMFKRTSSTSSWNIFDNKRADFNVIQKGLLANSNIAEFTGTNRCDFLSNGIKLRGSAVEPNVSGESYIYMAFAENPLVANTGGGIPATAR